MNESFVIDVFGSAIWHILMLSAPMLLSALAVGLLISIFQATTQIQEQTLAFIPKILITFLVLMMIGPWLLETLTVFARSIFSLIPDVIK